MSENTPTVGEIQDFGKEVIGADAMLVCLARTSMDTYAIQAITMKDDMGDGMGCTSYGDVIYEDDLNELTASLAMMVTMIIRPKIFSVAVISPDGVRGLTSDDLGKTAAGGLIPIEELNDRLNQLRDSAQKNGLDMEHFLEEIAGQVVQDDELIKTFGLDQIPDDAEAGFGDDVVVN